MKLSKDQKATLATIQAAGAEGVVGEASWASAKSLVRKGLVKEEIVARNMPAPKFYATYFPGQEATRYQLYTLQGRERSITAVRFTAV